MAARTIENCSVIKRAVAEGIGEPERFWNLNKCLGYCHSANDDEPIESCKNCKYYVSFEQEDE